MDGLEVCKAIRKDSNVPIIMLTAKDEELDRVLGLEIGADDYVTKPFSPRELVARIKAILRRTAIEQSEPHKAHDVLKVGPMKINLPNRSVSVRGEDIFFRPKEYDLLVYLVQNPGVVLTRDQLLEQVWGYDYIGDIRTVDVHVKKVREKLDRFGVECIHTVWGVGYRFECPSSGQKGTLS